MFAYRDEPPDHYTRCPRTGLLKCRSFLLPALGTGQQWTSAQFSRMIDKASARHAWSAKGRMLNYAKNGMPKQLDTQAPRGLTIQGQRWGHKEIASGW